jgi:hypothetical protein
MTDKRFTNDYPMTTQPSHFMGRSHADLYNFEQSMILYLLVYCVRSERTPFDCLYAYSWVNYDEAQSVVSTGVAKSGRRMPARFE